MKNVLLHLNSSARMDACDIFIHFLREDGFCFGQKSSQMFLRKHVRARVKPGITSPGNGFI